MIVKELIEQLKKFDPELKVIISNEEEEIVGQNNLVKFFDISHISSLHAETQRHELNRNVEFTFVGMPTKHSREFVFIDVVSQF